MRIMSKICMTKDIGVEGNLFGGNMLAWMDEAAAIYARTVTGESRMVTKQFGEIVFLRPVKVGDVVVFYCDSEEFGKTSVKFHISVVANDLIVFNTTAVFVAIDEDGKKKAIEKHE